MFWMAVVLGIVEGLTEFLPISSTGHLIVVSELLQFTGRRAEAFQIFIQLGAILAVAWEYRQRLTRLALDLSRAPRARAFFLRLFLGFLPFAAVGLAFHEGLLEYLFHPAPVAAALIVGGLLIFVVEALPLNVRTHDTESMNWKQALAIGLAQCLALWPGFSRSAATILGGLGTGLDRRTATEFSFFLALPTMIGATTYSLYRNYRVFEPGDALWLGLAFTVSFLVAWAAIRWLLRYVANHSFRLFAWYRIVLGAIILIVLGR